jgi:predicted metal-binding membrane protein
MLPSAVPLLRLFTEVSAAQAGRGRVLACFAGGYLAVWALFGGRRWCSTTSSTA